MHGLGSAARCVGIKLGFLMKFILKMRVSGHTGVVEIKAPRTFLDPKPPAPPKFKVDVTLAVGVLQASRNKSPIM